MQRFPAFRGLFTAAALTVSLGLACTSPSAAPAPAKPPAAPPPAATTAPASAGSGAAAPTAASAPTAPPQKVAVRIPYSALSLAMLPHWLAFDAGMYEREGLDVSMDYIASATVMGPALLSGEANFAYAGPEVVLSTGVQGGPMIIIGGGVDRALFWLATQPGVSAGPGLRDKRIGITRFGASTDVVLRFYLPTVGLSPERDVTILQMGGLPEAVGALQAGGIDAAVLSAPTVFRAQKAGAIIAADLGELDFPNYQDVMITTRSVLANQPDVARRVARGFAGGWKLMGDERQALESLKRYSREAEEDLLVDTYRSGIQRFPASPVPEVGPIAFGLQQLAQREPAAANVSAESLLAPEMMVEAWNAIGSR
jgi:NitT/TauT family transport system substrate-binding protein